MMAGPPQTGFMSWPWPEFVGSDGIGGGLVCCNPGVATVLTDGLVRVGLA